MKARYRLSRRKGIFYALENGSSKQQTRDRAEA